MKEVKEAYGSLKHKWDIIYEKLTQDPAPWNQHSPNISPDDVDVFIKTIGKWVDRSRAPAGHKESFKIVKSSLLVNLNNIDGIAQNIINNNPQQINAFVSKLDSLFSPLHTMIVLSRGDDKSTQADLAADLAEAYALVEKATSGLEEKLELCQSAEEWKNKAEEASLKSEQYKQEIEAVSGEILAGKEGADQNLAAILASKTNADKIIADFKVLLDENKALKENLDNNQTILNELIKDNEEQKNIIAGLLPDAASAGLAHSFENRRAGLRWSKYSWIAMFFASIAGIMLISAKFRPPLPEGIEYGSYQGFLISMLFRLPLIAPLIWSGIYSAIQYGYTVRIQEDYAFKKATAEAFVGYRDHMEHLLGVSDDEGKSALTDLSKATVGVLSREPLRVFGKNVSGDAMPAIDVLEKYLDLIKRIKGFPG